MKRPINGTIYNPDHYGPSAKRVTDTHHEQIRKELEAAYIERQGEIPQGPTFLEKKGVTMTNLGVQRPTGVSGPMPFAGGWKNGRG